MVGLSLRDCLQKVIDAMKLREWARSHRMRGVGFDHTSTKDFWNPKPEKCSCYPFDRSCESEDAHWRVCLGQDYNSKGELEKTMWLHYCDECYSKLNEPSAHANK